MFANLLCSKLIVMQQTSLAFEHVLNRYIVAAFSERAIFLTL
jgi:hypothetical protein